MKRLKKRNVLKDDEKAILGMPLQLLVMVIIAAVAIGIVAYWLTTGEQLDRIEISTDDYDYQSEGELIDNGIDEYEIIVTAYDQDGQKLNGATVKLSGLGLEKTKKTGHDNDGEAEFDFDTSQDNIGLQGNQDTGVIEVEVTYSASGPLGTTKTLTDQITVNSS